MWYTRLTDRVRLWLVAPLLVLVGACATLRTASGTLNWPVLLADAQSSVTEACAVQWLPLSACTLATDALTTASVAVAHAGGMTRQVARDLRDVYAALPSDARLRPYLGWVIAFLPA